MDVGSMETGSIDLAAMDPTILGAIVAGVVVVIIVLVVIVQSFSAPAPAPAPAAPEIPAEDQASKPKDGTDVPVKDGIVLSQRQRSPEREEGKVEENEALLQWQKFKKRSFGEREEAGLDDNEVAQLQWQSFKERLSERDEARTEGNPDQLQWQSFKERYDAVLDLMENNDVVRDAVFSLHFPAPYPIISSYTEKREDAVDLAIDKVRSFWTEFITDCRTGVLPPTDTIREKIHHWCAPSITFKFFKFAKSYMAIWSQLESKQDEYRERVSDDTTDRVKFVEEICG